LFGALEVNSLGGFAVAAYSFEVVAKLLDFEEVEDLLRFEDAVLFEK
jgi:hypothetical protein